MIPGFLTVFFSYSAKEATHASVANSTLPFLSIVFLSIVPCVSLSQFLNSEDSLPFVTF